MIKNRIIFDIGHPAHVHQFKHIYWALQNEGWEGLFSVKDKEIAIELLVKYNLPYKVIGKSEKGLLKKFIKFPAELLSFYKLINFFKPDFILSRFSPHATYISKLKRVTHIGFTDTEHVKFMDAVTVPFVDYKFTANSYQKDLKKNHFRFDGNIELFYLHPDLFKPDKSILEFLGIKENEKFVIIRFVSWEAYHDIGETGLSLSLKEKLVNDLLPYAKVFITSEKPLPASIEQYRINIPVEKIHDALAFASLYVGEGGTMASEAACMGTPSVYINSLDAGVFQEEEDFGLLYSFRNSNGVIEKAMDIIKDNHSKKQAQKNLQEYLLTTINVTAFVTWVIKDYPESIDILKKNPDYQVIFKTTNNNA